MNGRPWTQWEEGLRLREPAALKAWREELAGDIAYHVFTQYLFFQQWKDLKKYANKKGVQLIGDVPIYVSPDSADVWAQPGAVPAGREQPAHRGGRLPAGRLLRRRPAVGQPPVPTGTCMEEDGYRLVGAAHPGAVSPCSTCCASTTSGASTSYYAIPYGDTDGPEWPVEERPGRQIHPGH